MPVFLHHRIFMFFKLRNDITSWTYWLVFRVFYVTKIPAFKKPIHVCALGWVGKLNDTITQHRQD